MSTYTGATFAIDFVNEGKDPAAWCEDPDCECPEHDAALQRPRDPGTYITIRLDGDPRIGMSRWQLTELPPEFVRSAR